MPCHTPPSSGQSASSCRILELSFFIYSTILYGHHIRFRGNDPFFSNRGNNAKPGLVMVFTSHTTAEKIPAPLLEDAIPTLRLDRWCLGCLASLWMGGRAGGRQGCGIQGGSVSREMTALYDGLYEKTARARRASGRVPGRPGDGEYLLVCACTYVVYIPAHICLPMPGQQPCPHPRLESSCHAMPVINDRTRQSGTAHMLSWRWSIMTGCLQGAERRGFPARVRTRAERT